MAFQTKDSISVNGTLAINSSGKVVKALAVSDTSNSTIANTDSAGGTVLTITGTPYIPIGAQTWEFKTATSLGQPTNWISFPDGTIQQTGYPGSAPVLTTARNINGVSFNGSADITVTAAAGTLTGTSLNSTVVSSSLTSVGTLAGLRTTGLNNFGTNTFTKAGSATGDVALDNGGTDTPALLMYYANNSNFGIDSYNGSFSVLSGQLFRVTNNLNESGGLVKMAIDTTGNLATTGFVLPGAYRAGQIIKDTMLSNTELTVSTTTVATSTTDTDFITYSYTPSSNSSYLIIHVHVAAYSAASDTGGAGTDSYFSRIKVGGNEITYSRQMTKSTETFRTGVLFPLTGRYTNSDTTAKTITVGVRRDSADDNISIVNSATALWMRITEIAR